MKNCVLVLLILLVSACGGSEQGDTDNAPGNGTITFKGVTYELNRTWCGAFEVNGRRWQAFDGDEWSAGIMIRDDRGNNQYEIELDFNDGAEVWIFNPLHQRDMVEENATNIDSSEEHIRGNGLPVWPREVTDRDEQRESIETVDFAISC